MVIRGARASSSESMDARDSVMVEVSAVSTGFGRETVLSGWRLTGRCTRVVFARGASR